jgi:hypothetical protein
MRWILNQMAEIYALEACFQALSAAENRPGVIILS